MARCSDSPPAEIEKEIEEVNTHLQSCAQCRRDEFYFKQLSHAGDLLMPYQVSPNFNYRLETRLANAPAPLPLDFRPGIRKNHSWYFTLASGAALAVFALFFSPILSQKGVKQSPPADIQQSTASVSVPAPPVSSPFPLLGEVAQASERPELRLKPEFPIAAQFASAQSEPVRAGVDGEETSGWQDEYYWVGSSDRGLLMPARHYSQPAASRQSVLVLPTSGSSENVNIVY